MTNQENQKEGRFEETPRYRQYKKHLKLYKRKCLESYKKYLEFEGKIVKPRLEELWYLRVPAFTAVLSLILFAGIDQTLEVYRVFALNAEIKGYYYYILSSFILIFILSLCIWYSGRVLADKRKDEINRNYDKCSGPKESQAEQPSISISKLIQSTRKILCEIKEGISITLFGIGAGVSLGILGVDADLRNSFPCPIASPARHEALKWLPRIFGSLPLWALAFGLYRTMSSISSDFASENRQRLTIFHQSVPKPQFYLSLGIMITIVLACTFLFIVIIRQAVVDTCGNLYSNQLGDKLDSFSTSFSRYLLLIAFCLSVLAFSSFSFYFIKSEVLKLITCLILIFLVLLPFFLISRLISRKNVLICLSVLTILELLLAFKFSLEELPAFLGPINVIAIFLSIFVLFSSFIFYWGYYRKIAILTFLLALAIVSSLFNWNDNHHLREVGLEGSSEPQAIPELKQSFSRWIASRSEEILKSTELKYSPSGIQKDTRYPIYIISAQGGGIFAAYHAASTLSRLQDLCPAFARHVFAISGVSGGSLGVAVFSSLVKALEPPLSEQLSTEKLLQETPCFSQRTDSALSDSAPPGKGKLEQEAHALLNQDFLSPLLAAGLFPDFVQRFLPILFGDLDRARGLEYAFERAWENASKKSKNEALMKVNLLKKSYYEHWKPEESVPALVLNTTRVETGSRLVLSPFEIKLPNLQDIRTQTKECINNKDKINFPLSTAAVLSARFSFVTPVGWFTGCERVKKEAEKRLDKTNSEYKEYKVRLADGGYFENSGVSTAVDIGSRLEEFLRDRSELEKLDKKGLNFSAKIEKVLKDRSDPSFKSREVTLDKIIKVVYLSISDRPSEEIPEAGGLNELLSPILTLWNSKEARGLSVTDNAEYLTDPISHDAGQKIDDGFQKNYASQRFRQFYLHNDVHNDKKSFKLPLGWFLSKYSQDKISRQIGVYKSEYDCPNKTATAAFGSKGHGSNNQCVFRSIKEDLSPTGLTYPPPELGDFELQHPQNET